MDIKVNREVLLRALDRCLHSSSKDDPHPYGGTVLITVNDDETASLYSVGTYLIVDTAIPIEEVKQRGSQACSTRRLRIMANNLPGDTVHIKADIDNCRICVSGDMSRRYTAALVDSTMFPRVVEPPSDAAFVVVPGPNLTHLLNRVSHGTDSDRPHGDGIKIKAFLQEGGPVPLMEASTLNSYKLCIASQPQPMKGGFPFETFLPSRLIKPLLALAEKGEVAIRVGPSMVFAETKDTLIGAMLPRDVIPDLQPMVAQVEPVEEVCEIPTIPLRNSLKAICAVQFEKTSYVRFRFHGESLDLDLCGEATSATDTVRVSPKRTEPLEFFANPRYVLDHLQGADADCTLCSTKAPVAFKTHDGYLGFLSLVVNPPGANSTEERREEEDGGALDTKKRSNRPPKVGKKKAAKKTVKSSRKKDKPPPDPPDLDDQEQEPEDELGSADPGLYA